MVGFANQATPADSNRTEEGVTRPNTSPMDSWDFQPDKAKVFETLHNISSPDFLPGYQMLLQGYVQFCGPTHPPCVAVVTFSTNPHRAGKRFAEFWTVGEGAQDAEPLRGVLVVLHLVSECELC